MRQKTEQDIIHYIDFLRDMGFYVALGSVSNTLLNKSEPVLFNHCHHLCGICLHLKYRQETQGMCIRFKDLIESATTTEIIYNSCWAGVEEYVFPIVCSDGLLCRIHVSGYRGSLERSKRRAKVLKKRLGAEFAAQYDALSTDIPNRELLEKMIEPFAYMFEKLYLENASEKAEEDPAMALYIQTLRYIFDHYMENIQTETIAHAVNYSPSYLRSVFSKICGKSVMEYLNEIRLSRAMELLRYTKIPITKIAYECGFHDGNYFSTAFKKHYGVPPRAYRNKKFSATVPRKST